MAELYWPQVNETVVVRDLNVSPVACCATLSQTEYDQHSESRSNPPVVRLLRMSWHRLLVVIPTDEWLSFSVRISFDLQITHIMIRGWRSFVRGIHFCCSLLDFWWGSRPRLTITSKQYGLFSSGGTTIGFDLDSGCSNSAWGKVDNWQSIIRRLTV